MIERGNTPEEDMAIGCFESGRINKISKSGDGWSVQYSGIWSVLVKDYGIIPKIGDELTVFGRIGGSFHGMKINDHLLWYRDIEEEKAHNKELFEKLDRERTEKYIKNKLQLDADFEVLPPCFQARIERFRENCPKNFRVEYEDYEIFCCKEAVKLAELCGTAKELEKFGKLPAEEQIEKGLDKGHSGNTAGISLRLAYHYLTNKENVIKEHGAMVPLVGCKEYGCFH